VTEAQNKRCQGTIEMAEAFMILKDRELGEDEI